VACLSSSGARLASYWSLCQCVTWGQNQADTLTITRAAATFSWCSSADCQSGSFRSYHHSTQQPEAGEEQEVWTRPTAEFENTAAVLWTKPESKQAGASYGLKIIQLQLYSNLLYRVKVHLIPTHPPSSITIFNHTNSTTVVKADIWLAGLPLHATSSKTWEQS